MGEGGEVGLPHPVQEFGEGRVARGVGTQHQRVDEEADGVVQRLVRTARDGAADRDVVPGPVPGHQSGQGRLHHHEHTRPAAAGQFREGGVQLGAERDGQTAAPVRGAGGPRPVGGQRHLFGQRPQRLVPEAGLPGQGAVRVVLGAERGELGEGVVRVLERQRRERGLLTLYAGGVGGGEVGRQRLQGPAVSGDVVQHHGQHGPARAEHTEPGAQRGLGGQVEAAPGRGPQQLRQLVLGGRHGLQDGRTVGDPLARLAVGGFGEDGAQNLVPPHDIGDRAAQRLLVQLAVEPQHPRHVVRGVGAVEAVEVPQAALRERERNALGTRSRYRGVDGTGGRLRAERREPGDGRGLEHRPYGQLRAQRAADTGDEPGGGQRVPAQVEETVVDAHLGHSEHVREHLAQRPLHVIAGATTRTARIRRVVGGGQRLAVHLAVRGQGQRVQHDESGRNHVVRQPLPGGRAQLRDVRYGRAGHRHHIGGQPLFARRVLAEDDRDLPDRRVAAQHGFDLAQLDTETADLDLVVGPAQELQLPPPVPARQVPGAVHTGARTAVRVGDEPPRRQPGPAQVAARRTGAPEIELSRGARGNLSQRAVQHVRAHARHRAADRGPGGVREPDVGGVDRGLGRTVEVVDRRRALGQPGPQRFGQGLAADDEHGGRRRLEQPLVQQVLGERGRDVEQVQPVGTGVAAQRGRVAPGVVVDEVQLVARPHPQQLVPRGVESDRRGQRHPEAAPRRRLAEEPGPVRRQQVEHTAVFNGDALGRAGRAGGVDDVGGVRGEEGSGAVGVGEVVLGGRGPGFGSGSGRGFGFGDAVEQERTGCRRAQGVRGGRGGQGQYGPGVAQHVGDALRRVVQVDGQVPGPGLEYGQQAHHEVGGARQRQGDQVVGTGAGGGQGPRQAVGARVQLGEGQHTVGTGQGGRVRSGGGLRLEGGGQIPVGGLKPGLGLGFGLGLVLGCLRRARLPLLQATPFLLGQQVQARHHVRIGGTDETGEHGAEPGSVRREFGLAVPRVGTLEVDLQSGAVTPVADHHRQVLDRADRQVVGAGGRAGEAQPVVEVHDVDRGAGQLTPLTQQVEVAPEVFVAVALVPQRAAHLVGGVPYQFREAGVRADREPQRHLVRHHAGGAAHGGAAARGDRQAEHHIGGPGHPVQVDGEGGDQDGLPRGAPLPGRGLQFGQFAGREPVAGVPYAR
ncbi:hypothetical protein ADK76_11995 [Streptomyces griseoflavus]|nr:hypothetical protein ADK76_11995 [Streptomyces griseoflavus]